MINLNLQQMTKFAVNHFLVSQQISYLDIQLFARHFSHKINLTVKELTKLATFLPSLIRYLNNR
jgi:hypothetical protein